MPLIKMIVKSTVRDSLTDNWLRQTSFSANSVAVLSLRKRDESSFPLSHVRKAIFTEIGFYKKYPARIRTAAEGDSDAR